MAIPSHVWTVDEVKQTLPSVWVMFPDGHQAEAEIAGRKERFPTLYVELHGLRCCVGQATWECIAKAKTGDGAVHL